MATIPQRAPASPVCPPSISRCPPSSTSRIAAPWMLGVAEGCALETEVGDVWDDGHSFRIGPHVRIRGADPLPTQRRGWHEQERNLLARGCWLPSFPDRVLIERVGPPETLLPGQSQIASSSREGCKPCPVDKGCVRAPLSPCFYGHRIPCSELLPLRFQNSCKTPIPKLLSARHITKNRTPFACRRAELCRMEASL